MSIINDPIKTFKDQALKIWATKDFAERLAFSRTTWFLHAMYCFCIITVIDTFFIIVINDLFTLINFYDKSDFWIYSLVEDVYYGIHPLVEVAILYFWFSPKIIKTTLLISKAYSEKERKVFEWIEFRIKRKFPSYKTSTQRARERLDKPRKKGKLNIKFQNYLKTRNPVERLLLRGSLWLVYFLFIGSIIFFMLSATSETFNRMFQDETAEEVVDEAELFIEEARPERPTGMPPSTIFDIFIRSDSIVP